MLEKTIKKVISNTMLNWINSIEDDKLQDSLKNNVLVTGGCFVSLINNEEPNDFDVYIEDKNVLEQLCEYYIKKFELKDIYIDKDLSVGRVYIYIPSEGFVKQKPSNEKYQLICMSSNAITLTNKIQIVSRFYGDPNEIHKNYDFDHTKAYYRMKTNELSIPSRVYECIINKTLHYSGSLYPVCSVMRTKKFIERGWKINAGQYLKMCMQVSSLDLTDISVLRDQLVGVDSAYFCSLIKSLEDISKNNGNIDICKVIELTDVVFN